MSETRKRRQQPAGSGLVVLVDVGNTNTVFGVYQGDELMESFRLSTDKERTADEYGSLLLPPPQAESATSATAPTATGRIFFSTELPPNSGRRRWRLGAADLLVRRDRQAT